MPTRGDPHHMYWDTVLQQIFTVIKVGKKHEKLFFLSEKKTLFGILEIQFLRISHCLRFMEHFEINFRNNFWCSNI